MPQFRQLTRTATSTRHPTQGKIHTSRENATYTKGDFSRVYFQNVRLLLDAAETLDFWYTTHVDNEMFERNLPPYLAARYEAMFRR